MSATRKRPPLSGMARAAMRMAQEIAAEGEFPYVSTMDILLALARTHEGLAAQALMLVGEPDRLDAVARELRGKRTPPKPPTEDDA